MNEDLEFTGGQSGAESMLSAIQDRERQYTEEELYKDLDWIEASGKLYEMNEGKKFDGDYKELAKYGIDQMSQFNYNMTMGMIPDVMAVEGADHETQIAFAYLMDTYDKKDVTLNGLGRALKEAAIDPLNWIGIGTIGTGLMAKKGAQEVAKEGLKNRLHNSIRSYLTSGVAVGATEGALYTAGDEVAKESIYQDAGVMEGYSGTNIATSALLGLGAGYGITKGAGYMGKQVAKGIDYITESAQEEMARMAGGGTPPSEYKNMTLYHGTNAEFDKFESNYPRQAKGNFKGVYFADSESEALDYGKSIKKAQADIQNPLIGNPYEEYAKSKGIDFESNRFKIKKSDVEKWIDENKFDAIIRPSGTQYNMKGTEVIILDPSIIKDIE